MGATMLKGPGENTVMMLQLDEREIDYIEISLEPVPQDSGSLGSKCYTSRLCILGIILYKTTQYRNVAKVQCFPCTLTYCHSLFCHHQKGIRECLKPEHCCVASAV